MEQEIETLEEKMGKAHAELKAAEDQFARAQTRLIHAQRADNEAARAWRNLLMTGQKDWK